MANPYQAVSKKGVSGGVEEGEYRAKDGTMKPFFKGIFDGMGFGTKVSLREEQVKDWPASGVHCRLFGEVETDKNGKDGRFIFDHYEEDGAKQQKPAA